MTVITHTLSSGKVLAVSLEISFAEIVITGLLLILAALVCVHFWQELADNA
jgi:hypothetical protein